MNMLILEHLEGCTPLHPCASCKASKFLKEKLSSEDFEALLDIIRTHQRPGLDQSPSMLDLTVRATNALKNADISTIRQVLTMTEADFLRLPGFGGRKQIEDLKSQLAAFGYTLGKVPAE